MSEIIGAGVDLAQFEEDYHYNVNFDVIFVEQGTRLYTWLALKL